MKQNKWYSPLVIIVVVLGIGVVDGFGTPCLKEVLIPYGKLPAEAKIYHWVSDPSDPKRLAYVVSHEDRTYIKIQDRELTHCDQIGVGYPIFSNEGGHFIYIASQGKETRVVVDEQEQPLAFFSLDSAVISPLGKHVAYRVPVQGGQSVVADGELLEKALAIVKDSLLYSPDGNHLAYVAYLNKRKKVAVIDGERLGPYDSIQDLAFSPDSSAYVFKALIGRRWFVVKNGRKSRDFDKIGEVHFSPDAKHLAYAVQDNHKVAVILDGKTVSTGENAIHLTFSPDSRQLAFAIQKKGLWHCMWGDMQSVPHAGISPPYFSPDSKTRIYFGLDADNKPTLYVNGKKGPSYDAVRDFIYSPDSSHYVFRARLGDKWHIIRDGIQLIGYPNVVHPVFSADSKHLAYVAVQEDKMFVIRDDATGKAYSAIGPPLFSPDSQHLAHSACVSEDNWIIVIDGLESQNHFKGFLKASPLAFLNSRRVCTHALGEEIVRIEVELPEGLTQK